eukprot:CAMPEP_0117638458 /NCGR_PEP_ID=MMETSP0802-20121206/7830_1 /TAXON_ID=38833 /ORGANISM="Micromonas sp., Strain CCMP2099" /LENGTH=100 /DNA_ID=CAMNT_0005443377 /DNA_START=372 /DNA_END=671 /DNA_ORIENTATION=-
MAATAAAMDGNENASELLPGTVSTRVSLANAICGDTNSATLSRGEGRVLRGAYVVVRHNRCACRGPRRGRLSTRRHRIHVSPYPCVTPGVPNLPNTRSGP